MDTNKSKERTIYDTFYHFCINNQLTNAIELHSKHKLLQIDYYDKNINTFDTRLFIDTCYKKHYDIIKWLLQIKHKFISSHALFIALEHCLNDCNLKMAKTVAKYIDIINCHDFYLESLTSGNLKIVKWIFKLYNEKSSTGFNQRESIALTMMKKKHNNVVKWILKKNNVSLIPVKKVENFNYLFIEYVSCNNLPMANWLLCNFNIDINNLCVQRHLNILKQFLPQDFKIKETIIWVLKRISPTLIYLFIKEFINKTYLIDLRYHQINFHYQIDYYFAKKITQYQPEKYSLKYNFKLKYAYIKKTNKKQKYAKMA